ncbi:MAG: hypothetical protein Ct9H300mP1_20420 [Planctomycetaceae bacterium]|nr:MAG: hypothetical protein Ct9H300mP1_20420 [Planctomycetaceae bacterium]
MPTYSTGAARYCIPVHSANSTRLFNCTRLGANTVPGILDRGVLQITHRDTRYGNSALQRKRHDLARLG